MEAVLIFLHQLFEKHLGLKKDRLIFLIEVCTGKYEGHCE